MSIFTICTPIGTVRISSTPEQDKAMQDFINESIQNPGAYNLYSRNCALFVEDVLRAGGFNGPETIQPYVLIREVQKGFWKWILIIPVYLKFIRT